VPKNEGQGLTKVWHSSTERTKEYTFVSDVEITNVVTALYPALKV
jgi:hypothetical protein